VQLALSTMHVHAHVAVCNLVLSRCWLMAALATALWTATGSVAETQGSVRVHAAMPSLSLPLGSRSDCQRASAAHGLPGSAKQLRWRRMPLAAVGLSPSGGVAPCVETVTLRGHDVPLYLRGVLSGIAGGLAGSSVSFLLHPLDTLKTIKQANTGGNFKGWIEAGAAAIKKKGMYQGLYAGARTAAAGSFFSSALYFGT
jgi:hypothetical protein